MRRQHPRQVVDQAAPSDVRERLDEPAPQQRQQLLYVDARGREQRLAESSRSSSTEGSRICPLQSLLLHAFAYQREPVAVHTRRPQGNHHIAILDFSRAWQDVPLFHRTDTESAQIVLAVPVHACHLGRLTSNERGARLLTAFRDALHDRRSLADIQRTCGVVVEEEEWLRTAYQDVVHAHGHQVDANGVVLAHGLGDLQFRAHAIRARHQHRVWAAIASGLEVKEAPKTPQLRGVAARPVCGLAVGLDGLHQCLARVDVHTSGFIRKRIG
mmetsp:Transcript_18605/g.31313  ORF Transcript_18605/g.31313 Transcript_18605/m.31313 type:complete len:271 (+) Transcript_18605:1272-2084(+)